MTDRDKALAAEAEPFDKGVSEPVVFYPSDEPHVVTEDDRRGYNVFERTVQVTRNLMIFHTALTHDLKLSGDEVSRSWDDAFLTNVMVPYLEHLIERKEAGIEFIEDETGIGTASAQVSRDLMHETLVEEVIHLSGTRKILKEWRG